MKEKLALDLSPYKKMPRDEAHTSLSDDIASLSLEASGEINPYILIATRDGKVINPKRPSTDIKHQYSEDTKIEKKEKEAALKRRDYLLNLDGNYIVVWLSPSDPYPRGSLDVGIAREIGGQKALESYGIWVNFTKEQYLQIGKNLSSLSENKNVVENKEDLRKITFLITLDENDNPYDLLEEILPFKGVWERIRNKKAQEDKEKARKEADLITTKALKKLKHARSRREILEIGADLERQMQTRWSRIDFARSGCGITNAEALNEFSYTYSHHQIDKGGLVNQAHSENGQFVKKCPYCGTVIQRVIKPGYKCSCGNEYKGVC